LAQAYPAAHIPVTIDDFASTERSVDGLLLSDTTWQEDHDFMPTLAVRHDRAILELKSFNLLVYSLYSSLKAQMAINVEAQESNVASGTWATDIADAVVRF
jgi:hypothetical protein